MASAGRILIMPKGNYDSSVTYEMLDLVYYKGSAWLARKTVIGIEPSESNSEHWHKLCDSTDLSDCIKSSGGIMQGDLKLGNGKGTIHATDFTTYIRAIKDDNNYRDLRIVSPGDSETKTQFAQIVDIVDGTPTTYRLFGEHNKELLKPYIEQIIAEYLAKN